MEFLLVGGALGEPVDRPVAGQRLGEEAAPLGQPGPGPMGDQRVRLAPGGLPEDGRGLVRVRGLQDPGQEYGQGHTARPAPEPGPDHLQGVRVPARVVVEAAQRHVGRLVAGIDLDFTSLAQQAEEAGFTPADTRAVEEAVDEAIAESTDMIRERGMGAMGPLMGVVMQKLGGSADGKTVSEALRRKLSELDD